MKNKLFDRDVSVVFGDGQSVEVDSKSWVALDDHAYIDGALQPRKTMIPVHELLAFYVQHNAWVIED